MVKVNFEDKQSNDEDESIEKRYESTICNDYKKRPALYFIVRWSERHPDYEEGYICRSCAFGLKPQGIVEVCIS